MKYYLLSSKPAGTVNNTANLIQSYFINLAH